jgi:hypothetical protein
MGNGCTVTETFRKAAAPKHNLSHQHTLFTNKYRATMSGNGFFYKWNYIRTISGIFFTLMTIPGHICLLESPNGADW